MKHLILTAAARVNRKTTATLDVGQGRSIFWERFAGPRRCLDPTAIPDSVVLCLCCGSIQHIWSSCPYLPLDGIFLELYTPLIPGSSGLYRGTFNCANAEEPPTNENTTPGTEYSIAPEVPCTSLTLAELLHCFREAVQFGGSLRVFCGGWLLPMDFPVADHCQNGYSLYLIAEAEAESSLTPSFSYPTCGHSQCMRIRTDVNKGYQLRKQYTQLYWEYFQALCDSQQMPETEASRSHLIWLEERRRLKGGELRRYALNCEGTAAFVEEKLTSGEFGNSYDCPWGPWLPSNFEGDSYYYWTPSSTVAPMPFDTNPGEPESYTTLYPTEGMDEGADSTNCYNQRTATVEDHTPLLNTEAELQSADSLQASEKAGAPLCTADTSCPKKRSVVGSEVLLPKKGSKKKKKEIVQQQSAATPELFSTDPPRVEHEATLHEPAAAEGPKVPPSPTPIDGTLEVPPTVETTTVALNHGGDRVSREEEEVRVAALPTAESPEPTSTAAILNVDGPIGHSELATLSRAPTTDTDDGTAVQNSSSPESTRIAARTKKSATESHRESPAPTHTVSRVSDVALKSAQLRATLPSVAKGAPKGSSCEQSSKQQLKKQNSEGSKTKKPTSQARGEEDWDLLLEQAAAEFECQPNDTKHRQSGRKKGIPPAKEQGALQHYSEYSFPTMSQAFSWENSNLGIDANLMNPDGTDKELLLSSPIAETRLLFLSRDPSHNASVAAGRAIVAWRKKCPQFPLHPFLVSAFTFKDRLYSDPPLALVAASRISTAILRLLCGLRLFQAHASALPSFAASKNSLPPELDSSIALNELEVLLGDLLADAEEESCPSDPDEDGEDADDAKPPKATSGTIEHMKVQGECIRRCLGAWELANWLHIFNRKSLVTTDGPEHFLLMQEIVYRIVNQGLDLGIFSESKTPGAWEPEFVRKFSGLASGIRCYLSSVIGPGDETPDLPRAEIEEDMQFALPLTPAQRRERSAAAASIYQFDLNLSLKCPKPASDEALLALVQRYTARHMEQNTASTHLSGFHVEMAWCCSMFEMVPESIREPEPVRQRSAGLWRALTRLYLRCEMPGDAATKFLLLRLGTEKLEQLAALETQLPPSISHLPPYADRLRTVAQKFRSWRDRDVKQKWIKEGTPHENTKVFLALVHYDLSSDLLAKCIQASYVYSLTGYVQYLRDHAHSEAGSSKKGDETGDGDA